MSLELFNYEEFLPYYPDVDAPEFQQKILNKKEFSDLQLTRELKRPDEDGLLEHQKLIQRFLSPYTLYDELFIYHATGTGKTGVAFYVTENLYHSNSFSKVVVLAKGEALLISHRKNLIEHYSKRYKARVPEQIDPDKKNRFYKRLVSDFYDFRTFETFAKEIEGMGDEMVTERYSNTIFIVDEVHNIAEETKSKQPKTEAERMAKKSVSIYAQFHRLFHLVQNRKILLLSATPMRDEVYELGYLMNLILPLDQQMPSGKPFLQSFVSGEEIVNEDRLKEYLRGRMSILMAAPSNVRTDYKGFFMPPHKVIPFKIFKTTYESPQLDSYRQAYLNDSQRNDSIYSNVRQAALFVFPDGSYGDAGLKNYTTRRGGALTNELRSAVNTIDKLRKHSCKYAYVIQNILQNRGQKLVYVYCSIVNGSGINLFARILELYGYSRATGRERTKGYRYITLTSQTSNMDQLLQFFNQPENKFGDYCQVIIGSRKISEGFTFKNIQVIHVLTLHWNYTEIQQAVARGIRYRSHSELFRAGIRPTVEIYQHASVDPKHQVKSIDELMMEYSQRKDILVRKMDRIIKEISFDCPLVYERNYTDGQPDSRVCDYQACEYKCEDSGLAPTQVDLSTYQLYYQNKDEQSILEGIRKLFKTYFRIQLETLQDILQVEAFPLLRVLSYLIRYNIPLVNAYDIECFLREDHNEYYLVDNVVLPNDQSDLVIYTQQPFITANTSLQEATQNKSFQRQIRTIRGIQQANTEAQMEPLLKSLSIELQEVCLEMAWLNPRSEKSRWIQHIYRDSIQSTREYATVSVLLAPRIRGLDEKHKVWRDCTLDEQKEENEVAVDIEHNPYGYYGIVEDDRFCIRDITQAISEDNQKIDKRKITTGSNCMEVGYNKPKLAEICLHLGLVAPENELHPNPRKELMKNRSGQKVLENWNGWSDQKLAQGLYWYNHTKKELCDKLRNWFAENHLLVRDKCGKSGKVKKTDEN